MFTDWTPQQWQGTETGLRKSQDRVGRACAASSARERGGFVLHRRSLGSQLRAYGVCRRPMHSKAASGRRGQRMARAV